MKYQFLNEVGVFLYKYVIRIANCIDKQFIGSVIKTLKVNGKINLNANKDSAYEIVKYLNKNTTLRAFALRVVQLYYMLIFHDCKMFQINKQLQLLICKLVFK